MARNDDNTGRNLALAGGGAALLWLLLRGGGGFGLGGKGGGAGSESKGTAKPVPPRANVRVAADGITVDGVPTDVAGAAAIVKERGHADVLATGAARQGIVDDLLKALRATGAEIWIVGGARG